MTNELLKSFRILTACVAIAALGACSTDSGSNEYAAYGYLSPGPDGEGELIGVFPTRDECETAADGWASRQVVGNPVYAECYPVDRD